MPGARGTIPQLRRRDHQGCVMAVTTWRRVRGCSAKAMGPAAAPCGELSPATPAVCGGAPCLSNSLPGLIRAHPRSPGPRRGGRSPDASLRGHLTPRLTGRAARLSSTPTLRTHSWSAPTGARRAPRALEDVKKLLLAVDWQSKAQVRTAFRTRRAATRTPTPSGTRAPRSGRAAPARTRLAAQPPDPAPRGLLMLKCPPAGSAAPRRW